MTDYTDILTRLDNKAELNLMLNKEAAEAIRQLVAERGAALVEFNQCSSVLDDTERHVESLESEITTLKSALREGLDTLEMCKEREENLINALMESTKLSDNLYSKGRRLALELECLLLDVKDTAIVSKWWDSAHEALEDWRK